MKKITIKKKKKIKMKRDIGIKNIFYFTTLKNCLTNFFRKR